MNNDPIDMLMADHREVESLFKATKGEPMNLQPLADQIANALTTHTEMEERVFYPAVQARAKEESDILDDWMIKHSYDEHGLVKKMLEELSEKRGDESALKHILWRIEKAVQLHVLEEERILFPHARNLLDQAELDRVGTEMMAIKQQRRPAA